MTAIGAEEKAAVMRVMDSGVLSGFLAGGLHGGPEVNALEEEWANYFGFKHAIAMNSATSCLIAACGAVGVRAGDYVAVPPLTMSASATCMMPWGGKPIFIDIEPDYFCLDVEMYSRFQFNGACTAVITVDIFGQASNEALRDAAQGIPIIQDASQRPIPGGFGDIVVYSLNYHKHIHCGEGGVACTNSDVYAERLRLIRNHAECAADNTVLYGFNFRMTEIEAAIARVQLTKLPGEIKRRQELAKTIPNLAPARPTAEHAWYLFPHTEQVTGSAKYSKPLYTLPIFRSHPLPNTEAVWEALWMTRP